MHSMRAMSDLEPRSALLLPSWFVLEPCAHQPSNLTSFGLQSKGLASLYFPSSLPENKVIFALEWTSKSDMDFSSRALHYVWINTMEYDYESRSLLSWLPQYACIFITNKREMIIFIICYSDSNMLPWLMLLSLFIFYSRNVNFRHSPDPPVQMMGHNLTDIFNIDLHTIILYGD